MIREFYGNYVAFLCNSVTKRRYVVRAPCSTLPCLHTRVQRVDVYFSSMETCAQLFPASFSVDLQHLVRTLVGPLLTDRTGLNEVREILPGFCEELGGATRSCELYWDPVEIATSNPIESFPLAVAQLRSAILSAAHAWASRMPRILHALSGGLDSSIVLSCLYTAPTLPAITCLTHFAEGAEGDERPFARAAARQFDCPHLEVERSAQVDLRGALHGLRFESNPGMRVRDIERIEPDIAREINADALTKGLGGDELFCRHHSYLYAADLLRDRGVSVELFDLLAHSAIFEGETLWTILWRVMKGAWLPQRWNVAAIFHREQQQESLLNRDILATIESADDFGSPYARTTRKCGPGKLWQIDHATARRPYSSVWWREGDPQSLAPFLSQNVVETCLRIPTYFAVANRGERAVARAAFAELPPEVIARRSKGGSEELAWRTLRANLPFMRELLLDGELARQRIVNRALLEAALADDPTSGIHSTVPLFELVGAEAWLAPWAAGAIRSEPSRTAESSAASGHPAG
ncbi:MAG: asparagine synthase C-terminal domain-containing protein [Gammaproteobacteria bacterium]